MNVYLITALLLFSATVVQSRTPTLLGGWMHHKNPSNSLKFFNLAFDAFAAMFSPPYLHGTNLRIVKASTQVVNGINYKLEVEKAEVSCGFKQLEWFPTHYNQNPYKNLICWTGKVVEVCTIELHESFNAKKATVQSFDCRKP
uniref:Putative conserved secreted protein n=1 Tax=Amblyomma aureolatum TaxID=187763 RepID=A0A1E1X0A7_9ACAR